MRFRPPDNISAEGDMTPMIDMTFQLIAFFMMLLNFSGADQDERIQLPSSVLAKPPEGPIESPVTIHMTADGDLIYGGEYVSRDELRRYLIRERDLLRLNNKSVADATVVIRADADAQTGWVQELIQLCQQERFEKFTLRAKEEVGH